MSITTTSCSSLASFNYQKFYYIYELID